MTNTEPDPRWGTPRRTTRPDRLPALESVATDLDLEMLPWQRTVAATATELDAAGSPAYDVVMILAPPGSGKTTLGIIAAIERLRATAGSIAGLSAGPSLYTAGRALTETCSLLRTDDLDDARLYTTNGKEGLRFGNGSVLEPQDAKDYGPTRAITVFAKPHDAKASPLAALSHSLTDNGQLWIALEANADPLVQTLIDIGREAAETDAGSGTAYFEWSAADSDDLDDEATWRRCMPALGHLTNLDDVRRRYRRASDFGELEAFNAAFAGRIEPPEDEGVDDAAR